MTKRVKKGEVNACQTPRSKLRVRAFFFLGGRAGGWTMARKRGKQRLEIKYSLLYFCSSEMLLNRTAANCGKPSFYEKICQ